MIGRMCGGAVEPCRKAGGSSVAGAPGTCEGRACSAAAAGVCGEVAATKLRWCLTSVPQRRAGGSPGWGPAGPLLQWAPWASRPRCSKACPSAGAWAEGARMSTAAGQRGMLAKGLPRCWPRGQHGGSMSLSSGACMHPAKGTVGRHLTSLALLTPVCASTRLLC